MSFEPENPLEEALMRASRNAMSRREFERLLLESDLIVIGRIEGRDTVPNGSALAPDEKLQIASTERDGKRYIPVFSSMTRLKDYLKKDAGYVALKGRALFEMTRGSTLLLNLGADFGRELLPEEIGTILGHETAVPIVTDQPLEVLVAQPAVYPQALVDALKRSFAARPEVLAAYLVQIGFPGRPPYTLIGVETIGDWQAVSAEIGRIAAGAAPGQSVNAVPVDRTEQDGVMVSLLQTEPFFFRRTSTT
jgi:hypothetical protein